MLITRSVASIREVEGAAVATAPTDALMVKAAGGVADAARDLLRPAEDSDELVIAFVGGGDNGGDALYASAFLATDGYEVEAILLTDHPHERGLNTARLAGVQMFDCSEDAAGRIIELSRRGTLWIDGCVGTGVQGDLREPLRSIIAGLEEIRMDAPEAQVIKGPDGKPAYEPGEAPRDEFSKAPTYQRRVVAIDVHSGVATPDGSIPGPALRADIVVTMGAVKPALVLPPAAYLHSQVRMVDLDLEFEDEGVTRTLTRSDFRRLYPVPGRTDHKYTRGVARLVTGSEQFPGAAVLSCVAAQNTGIGMVRLDTTRTPGLLALHSEPGIVLGAGRAQSIAVGSGMDPSDVETRERIHQALADARADDVPVVIDAGALTIAAEMVAEDYDFKAPAIWTPHAGEAAAVLNILDSVDWTREDVERAPLVAAQKLASLTDGIIVLKGAATLIANPRERVYVQAEAPAWAGVAGSGDILTGVIAARVAQTQADYEKRQPAASSNAEERLEDITETVASAVWLHGVAASAAAGLAWEYREDPLNPPHSDTLGGPIGAQDIARYLPHTIWQLLDQTDEDDVLDE